MRAGLHCFELLPRSIFAELFLLLARGVTRIASGLLLGFQGGFRSFLFGLEAARFRGNMGCVFGFARELLNASSLAQLLRFRARGSLRLPLGSLLQDRRIIWTRLGLEFIENALSGVLRGSLPVRKTWFLKTHRVDFFLCSAFRWAACIRFLADVRNLTLELSDVVCNL